MDRKLCIEFLLVMVVGVFGDQPCPDSKSISLENGIVNVDGSVTFDNLTFPKSAQFESKGLLRGCPCKVKRCAKMCCPMGQLYDAKCHEPTTEAYRGFRLPYLPKSVYGGEFEEDFYVLYDNSCDTAAFAVYVDANSSTEVHAIDEEGTFAIANKNNGNVERYASERYCVSYSERREMARVKVCRFAKEVFEEKLDYIKRRVETVCSYVSVLFLVMTLIVYGMFSSLRNLYGKALICQVSCMAVAYCVLPIIKIEEIVNTEVMSNGVCRTMAYIVHFSFLASFFWLNVMCFDIWWTFGGFRTLHGSVKQRERKKFIMYSIYAWGCATLLTMITMVMDLVPGIPDNIIRPEFGKGSCWFESKAARALYFYVPMGLTIICNICLFIATALKIIKHKKDTARQLKGSESRRHDDNKQWFNLYLKLFIVMGINWSMEIISWLLEDTFPKYYFYLTDLTNTLQGLIIFIIFVWKDKIRRLLMKRFGCDGDGLFRNSTSRSGCATSSTSARTTCISGAAPLQEKVNPYADTYARGKSTVTDDSDCI